VNASADDTGSLRAFHSWAPGEPGWTALPDAPADYATAAVELGDELFVQFGDEIHVFDPAAGAWEPTVLSLPMGSARARIVSAGGLLYAIVSNETANSVEFWRYTQ
jgi:hypothetical protein